MALVSLSLWYAAVQSRVQGAALVLLITKHWLELVWISGPNVRVEDSSVHGLSSAFMNVFRKFDGMQHGSKLSVALSMWNRVVGLLRWLSWIPYNRRSSRVLSPRANQVPFRFWNGTPNRCPKSWLLAEMFGS